MIYSKVSSKVSFNKVTISKSFPVKQQNDNTS